MGLIQRLHGYQKFARSPGCAATRSQQTETATPDSVTGQWPIPPGLFLFLKESRWLHALIAPYRMLHSSSPAAINYLHHFTPSPLATLTPHGHRRRIISAAVYK